MGNTIEQHRAAIGRFKLPGCQQVSARTRRWRLLGEIMTILSVEKIRCQAKQVDKQFFLFKTNLIYLQVWHWQDLFLFFALSALWLFSAMGLQELILTSSQEAVKQHNCLPFAFPNHPSNLVRMGNYSTMLMDTLSPIKLEFDIFGLVQMLLVMSGIQTNPGPASVLLLVLVLLVVIGVVLLKHTSIAHTFLLTTIWRDFSINR